MYSRVRAGKHLSDKFPTENSLKKKRCSSKLIFNFALKYAIIRVQINQEGLKLNGTSQGLVYDEEFGQKRTYYKSIPALIVARKEIGIELNVGKTRNTVIFRDQIAGRSYSIKIEN
jgi:hypothetical protein